MVLKILHVSNIAQNGYINALILNNRGHDCDLLAYDMYHVACSPEGYELINSAMISDALGDDDFFPDFYALGRAMPRIADWVSHGPFFAALNYLIMKRRGDPLAQTALSTLAYLRFKATLRRTMVPSAAPMSDDEFAGHLGRYDLPSRLRRRIETGRMADRYADWIRARVALRNPDSAAAMSFPVPVGALDPYVAADPWLKGVLQALRGRGLTSAFNLERTPLQTDTSHLQALGFEHEDVAQFVGAAPLWRELASHYDVCLFYADTCIHAFSAGLTSYCALEHGSIRTAPFEPTFHGRLLTAAFLNAKRVFLTNTDYATAKPRLEFASDQRVYFPHPFDEAIATRFRSEYLPTRDPDRVVFFCPARQDWRSNDPKMAKGNDRYLRAAKRLLDRGRNNFLLRCVDWGVDREASRALVAELGLIDHVRWMPVMPKGQLWAAMVDAHAVMDQFLLSAFGASAIEAFALGCRLISCDNGVNNAVFFDEAPPFLAAATADEIAARMEQVMDDPDDEAELGRKGVDWIAHHHSAERIHALQMAALQGLPGLAEASVASSTVQRSQASRQRRIHPVEDPAVRSADHFLSAGILG